MIYIENHSTDPHYNLALEEYCLKNMSEEIVMLWRDHHSIIIGKHQNTIEEVNGQYVEDEGIKVARRITGGGAVYHDLGNLNFTFILNVGRVSQTDFKDFALPVVKALAKMGVTAELSGRNDITIDGKKISGTAQRVMKNRLLYHGTLLFDSNLEVLTKALKVKKEKIESKGVKSVRSRVTNIKEHLNEDYDVLEFKKLLLEHLFEDQEIREYQLTEEELAEVKKLQEEKYVTWDWTYGKSPKSNVRNSQRFAGGQVEVLLNIEKGLIENCKFYGDFLGIDEVTPVEELLRGKRYDRQEVAAVLDEVEVGRYFGGVTKEEVLSCLFD